jgi:hypothetical protein
MPLASAPSRMTAARPREHARDALVLSARCLRAPAAAGRARRPRRPRQDRREVLGHPVAVAGQLAPRPGTGTSIGCGLTNATFAAATQGALANPVRDDRQLAPQVGAHEQQRRRRSSSAMLHRASARADPPPGRGNRRGAADGRRSPSRARGRCAPRGSSFLERRCGGHEHAELARTVLANDLLQAGRRGLERGLPVDFAPGAASLTIGSLPRGRRHRGLRS